MRNPKSMRASAAQRGLWFAQSVAPNPSVFTIGHLVDFDGPIDADRLARATRSALAEADGLRSRFRQTPDDVDVTLGPAIDVGRTHLGSDESAIDTVARRVVDQCIDLVEGPTASVTILSAGQRLSLLITAHHIVLDAYGIGLFTRRIAALYADPSDPRALRSVTDVPVGFDEPRDGDADFWDQEIAGIQGPLTLSGGPRPHRVAHAVRTTRVVLAGIATTPPARLIAAIAAFCARQTDSDEVVLGLPLMNRFGSPAANVPCTLVNVVPLRVPTPMSATLDDLATETSDRQRRIAPHVHFRGEDIVRSARHSGVDGVVGPAVNIKPFGATITFGDVPARLQSLARGPVVDMSITALDIDGGVELTVDADADLYDDQRLRQISTSLTDFLDGIYRCPHAPIGALPVDTRAEEAALTHIASLDREHRSPIDDTPIVDRILRNEPSTPAVICGDDMIDFGELDRRSAELADALGPLDSEDTVAVVLPRGIELVVALVAVLRAHAAFVPIDPAFPRHRIDAVIADADPVAVIEAGARRAVVRRRQASHHVVTTVRQHNPAYLIYTSGTTGHPKGVTVSHRALQNFADAMIEEVGYTTGSAVLAVTTISFDIAILETLVPLVAGATVVLATTSDVHDPHRLVDLITRHRIRWMQATPSLWTSMIDAGHADALADVNVLVGGEQLSADLARSLVDAAASVRNMYGPTETTIWSTTYPVRPGAAVSIGSPIANTGVRILDSALHPVANGTTGELYLTGAGLARGYRGLPGMTALRFVADPFGTPGSRMYRTGDIARLGSDGTIECLGRTDHQVKIRGFRIELGDVESALTGHPEVEHAVAAALDGRLIGYVTPPTTADLRTYLAERLPDYMIPAAVVGLTELPLTPNGKIDRRALPAPDFAAMSIRGRAPLSESQHALVQAFCAVLGLPGVGVDDNFFAVGGDSITAVRVVRHAAAAGINITPLDIFDHPTVAGLARVTGTIEQVVHPDHAEPGTESSPRTTAGVTDDEFDELIEGNLL